MFWRAYGLQFCETNWEVHFETCKKFGHYNATYLDNHKVIYYKGGNDDLSQVWVGLVYDECKANLWPNLAPNAIIIVFS